MATPAVELKQTEKPATPYDGLTVAHIQCPLCKLNQRFMMKDYRFAVLCKPCWLSQQELIRQLEAKFKNDRQRPPQLHVTSDCAREPSSSSKFQ